MYCRNCGKLIDDKAKFCPGCGAPVVTGHAAQSGKTIKMKCQSCGGVMDADEDEPVLICPFCGSKELIVESEAVTIERIRSKTFREIAAEKNKTLKEIEKTRFNYEKEKDAQEQAVLRRQQFKKGKLSKIMLVFAIVCALFSLGAFSNYNEIAGFIALIQTAILIVALLMGYGVIKEKSPGYHIVLFAVACFMILPFMWGMNGGSHLAYTIEDRYRNKQKESQTFTWPSYGLITRLPEPKSHSGEITDNSDTYAHMYVYKFSQEDFAEYVNECAANGFTTVASQSKANYEAYSEDKTELHMYYDVEDSYMTVRLTAAPVMSERKWPKNGISQVIPAPTYTVCNISNESNTGFDADIGEYSVKEFNDYTDACIDLGFTERMYRSEYRFSAKNKDGDSLSLAFNPYTEIMHIDLYNYERD